MLDISNIDFVIYHHPCPDGYACAWIINNYFKDKHIKFYPTNYGIDPPNVYNKNVIICDFSYSYKNIKKMIDDTKGNLLIIDHHKSAKENLEKIDNEYKIFDMNRSGVGLVWTKFYGEKSPPLLLKYIEDNDLWKHELYYSKEFTALLQTIDLTTDSFNKLSDDIFFEEKLRDAKHYIAINNCHIENALSHIYFRIDLLNDGRFYLIAYVNSTHLISNIGNEIIKKYPLVDFAAVYHITEKGTKFSLRSSNEHVDVSLIAKQYGGGGHRNASGLLINKPVNGLKEKYYNIKNPYNIIKQSIIFELPNNQKLLLINFDDYHYELACCFLKNKYKNSDVQVQTGNFQKEGMIKYCIIWWYDKNKNIDWKLYEVIDTKGPTLKILKKNTFNEMQFIEKHEDNLFYP